MFIAVKNLGSTNKKYWQHYQAGTTPGVPQEPADTVLSRISLQDPILDIGTGQGSLADSLAARGYTLYGIDINSNEIKENQKRGTGVNYSAQDIVEGTNFPDGFFKLVIFRYTLTNIHKDQWHTLTDEINRITQAESYLWLVEPLVSESYRDRYSLASSLLEDDHAFFVFKDKELAKEITTKEQLEQAIENNSVSRIVRHYSVEEIVQLFPKFKLVNSETVEIPSPSGYPINTLIAYMHRVQ